MTTNIFNDAGLFRQWLVEHYGHIIRFGGQSELYWRAVRLAGKLAKMTHQTTAAVIASVIEDHESLDEE